MYSNNELIKKCKIKNQLIKKKIKGKSFIKIEILIDDNNYMYIYVFKKSQ